MKVDTYSQGSPVVVALFVNLTELGGSGLTGSPRITEQRKYVNLESHMEIGEAVATRMHQELTRTIEAQDRDACTVIGCILYIKQMIDTGCQVVGGEDRLEYFVAG